MKLTKEALRAHIWGWRKSLDQLIGWAEFTEKNASKAQLLSQARAQWKRFKAEQVR